jgi:FemAB-related protein (PEP-CTERM system-associated)
MTQLQLEIVQASDSEADALVTATANASPYFLSGWRRAVQKVYGHQAGCLLARERASKQSIALLPYSVFKRPLQRPRVISQPFADYSGVLTINSELNRSLEADFRAQLGQNAVELRHSAQDISPQPEQLAKVRMITQLLAGQDALLASYKPKLRSQIKKATKNGLTAELSTDSSAIKAFYQIYASNMRRLGSPAHHPDWFQYLLEYYPPGSLQVVLVRLAEQVTGAAIVLINGNQAVIPWASTLAEFNHLAPNMLLYWTIQSYLADRGVTTFDMGRSTPGEGTYRFKQQWGAQPYALDWQLHRPGSEDGIALLQSDKAISGTRKVLEQLWRCLPQSLANQLGGQLRGYISL